MTTESDLNSTVDSIFEKYLASNKKLWGYFEDNSGADIYSLEIDGKVYRKPPSPKPELVDYGIHTCGNSTFPKNLKSTYRQKVGPEYVKWSESQISLIEDQYKKITWDLKLFEEAKNRAKNCWPSYLSERAWYERVKKTKNSHNLEQGDILNFISPNWDQIFESLVELEVFRDLKEVRPYDSSRGAISISLNLFDLAKTSPDLQIKEMFIDDFLKEHEGNLNLSEVRDLAEKTWAEMELKNEEEIEHLKNNGIEEVIWNPRPYISAKIYEFFCRDYYFCEHFEITSCVFCGTQFYPQSQRRWLYLLPPEYCDFCLGMITHQESTDFFQYGFSESEIKKNMVFGVKNYFDTFGYIPKSGQNRAKTILKLLSDLGIGIDLNKVLKTIALLPPKDLTIKYFKTWSHLLAEAELLELTNRGKGGYRSIATDGHICLSLGERAICEFLSRSKIEHSKEPMYPKHRTYNPNGLLRADFEISGIFIEFAGMMENPDYAKRMKNKELLARSKKVPWFKLEAAEVSDLMRLEAFIKEHI
jgi:hypothetical protein